MTKLRGWNPTIVLWAANTVVWPLLAIVATYQFGLFGVGGNFPPVQPLAPQPIRLTMQVADAAARNPFDPNGSHWRSLPATASAAPSSLRGVVVLPGVRAAMTGADLVYVGGQLAGGRVTEIRANRVVVQREGETIELDIPSMHPPALQDLSGQSEKDDQSQEMDSKRGAQ